MHKNARIFLFLLGAVLFFSGCSRTQAPTASAPTDGIMGGENDYGGAFVPEGGGDYSLGPEGLELRGSGEGIGDGMYDGRVMVENVLPSVYFGFDSSSISASERGKLQEAAEYLEANPSHGLLIEGHCDWYGTAEYNLALGDRRAESASNYLGTLGITPLRIDTLSKGSLEATSGLSKSQSSQDRRADLIILK